MNKQIFRNFLTVFLPLVVLYLLFSCSKVILFEDYLHLYKIKDAKSFITTTLGTLATIVSITVALVILSFNTFKQKAGEYAMEYFVSIKELHYLVALYLTGILLMFLSLIEVSKFENANTLNLIYFNLYLFILSLSLMVRLSYSLFKKISISELIQYYFSKLDKKFIEDSRKEITEFKNLELKFNNPFFVIEDLGLNAIRRGDFFISNLIFSELNKKIAQFISEAKDIQEVNLYFDYITKTFRNIIPESLSKNNSDLLIKIWIWFETLHKKTNHEMKKTFRFWRYLESFGCSYYQDLIEANQYEIADQFFETVLTLFHSDIIKVFPHEKEIHSFGHFFKEGYSELYGSCPDDGFLKDINEDWKNYIEIVSGIYYSCGQFNLKKNDERALLKIISQLTKQTTFQDRNSQPLKALYVFRKFYPLVREFLERGFDRNIFNKDMGETMHELNPMRKIYSDEKIIYENNVLGEYGNLLVLLQRFNLIDYAIVGGQTLGNMTFSGELGELSHRYIYRDKNKVKDFDCLTTIFDIIDVLNSKFEKDLVKNSGYHFRLRERLIYLDDEIGKLPDLPEKGVQLQKNIKALLSKMNSQREQLDKTIEQ